MLPETRGGAGRRKRKARGKVIRPDRIFRRRSAELIESRAGRRRSCGRCHVAGRRSCAQIRESMMAGPVARALHRRAGQAVRGLSRSLEPAGNRPARRAGQWPAARLYGAPPAGAMNVMPLLKEIETRAEAHRAGQPTAHHHLHAAADERRRHVLPASQPRAGAVRLISKGYGSCRVLSTATGQRLVGAIFQLDGRDHSRYARNRRSAGRRLRGGSGFSRQRPEDAGNRRGLF